MFLIRTEYIGGLCFYCVKADMYFCLILSDDCTLLFARPIEVPNGKWIVSIDTEFEVHIISLIVTYIAIYIRFLYIIIISKYYFFI